jgi:hypothetical protein
LRLKWLYGWWYAELSKYCLISVWRYAELSNTV